VSKAVGIKTTDHVLRLDNSRSRQREVDAPLQYLSSDQAGWGDLTAEAFLEPAEVHGWKRSTTSDVRLMLFAGGPLLFDPGCMKDPVGAQVVREGDFVLRPGVDPYEVGWKSLSSAPTRAFVLHFDRELLFRIAEELDGHDPARILLQSRVGFQDPLLKEICLTLWRELEQHVGAGKLYLQTAAQMLAVHLLRRYSFAPIRINNFSQVLTQRQLRSVTDLVLSNPGKNLSLRSLAAKSGLSPFHFARLFRMTTGTSPHQFVLAQRLEKAKCLLRETEAALADVALDAGFANQSHMTRMFKRRFGLTPRAYRKANSPHVFAMISNIRKDS